MHSTRQLGVDRVLRLLAGVFAAISGIAVVLLCGITVVSVFCRYVLNAPIHGIEDISTLALSVVVAGSLAWAAVNRGHVAVNILPSVLSRHGARVTDAVARLAMIAALAVAAWAMFVKGSCGLMCGDITPNLGISHVPYYWGIGAALGFYALVVTAQLGAGFGAWKDDADPNEIGD